MNPLTLILVTQFLLVGPPAGEAPAAPTGTEAPALDDEPAEGVAEREEHLDGARFRAATAELKRGVELGDDHPEEAVPILEQALAALPEFTPLLAADPDALELRAEAHVSLARAHLQTGHDAEAIEVMDEAIRSALGEPLPVAEYGPTVEKLWTERLRHAREHPGRDVLIKCWVDCHVYVNERLVTTEALRNLAAGTYRFWVEAEDGSIDRMETNVELSEEVQQLEFGTAPPPPEPKVEEPPPEPLPPPAVEEPPAIKRALPRWAEITGMVVGAGLIGASVALFVIDDTCTDGGNIDTCPRVFDTTPAGFGLMSAGAGLFTLGTLFLSADEVRVARHKKAMQVSVGWTVRF